MGVWLLARSDDQLHETVILTDVPLENVLAGAQHALKSSAVQLHALECGLGCDCGSTGSLQKQCNLPWKRSIIMIVNGWPVWD